MRVLIIGNAPLERVPDDEYDVVFYFSNNSKFVSSLKSNKVFGVMQDFTIDVDQWKCEEWGRYRKEKYNEFLKFYHANYDIILMNSGLDLNLKSIYNLKNINYINHRKILYLLLKHIGLYSILKEVNFKGVLNYLLLLLHLKDAISGQYRPSSGFFTLLFAIENYPNHEVFMIGFSDPSAPYVLSDNRVLINRPHFIIDNLIFKKLSKSKFKLIK